MPTITVERPSFRLNCDAAHEERAESIADLVDALEASKRGVVAGVTVQVGWSMLKLVKHGRRLVLCEPDFSGDPFTSFRPDISTTLDVLARQSARIAELGCEPIDFRYDDKIVFKNGCLSGDKLFATRSEPTKGDSGWYIAAVDDDDDDPQQDNEAEGLEAMFAYELLDTKPHLLDVLTLPVRWVVLFDESAVTQIINHDDKIVWP